MESFFKCIPLCTGTSQKLDKINRSACQLRDLNSNFEIFSSKKTLVTLELQRNMLRSSAFTKFFQTKFPKLEYLDLSDNELCDRFFTHANFQQIKTLESLNLNRNPELETLDANINQLTALRTLKLEQTCIVQLPLNFSNLKHLTELQINGSGLQILPGNIGNLSELKILGCRENGLQNLPDSFCFLKSLEELDLGENIITHLPQNFGMLKKLKHFNLDDNDLYSLPQTFGELEGLESLDISKNYIEDLPFETNWTNLVEFTATSNKIVSLPASIGKCENLEILKVDENELDELPESIGLCNSLQELILNDNQIMALPSVVGRLENLIFLNVNGNMLRSVPREVGNLDKLKILSLRNNSLSLLPTEISNLSNLTVLDVSSNKIDYFPLSMDDFVNKPGLTIWLSCNQSEPMKFHKSTYENTTGLTTRKMEVITCALLPQEKEQFFTNTFDRSFGNGGISKPEFYGNTASDGRSFPGNSDFGQNFGVVNGFTTTDQGTALETDTADEFMHKPLVRFN